MVIILQYLSVSTQPAVCPKLSVKAPLYLKVGTGKRRKSLSMGKAVVEALRTAHRKSEGSSPAVLTGFIRPKVPYPPQVHSFIHSFIHSLAPPLCMHLLSSMLILNSFAYSFTSTSIHLLINLFTGTSNLATVQA